MGTAYITLIQGTSFCSLRATNTDSTSQLRPVTLLSRRMHTVRSSSSRYWSSALSRGFLEGKNKFSLSEDATLKSSPQYMEETRNMISSMVLGVMYMSFPAVTKHTTISIL
ncbi:hypothetical protein QYE76_016262 [Lolium multiflorum]|uniref:Uncharacterized protein n=1 Tax=Lolium multiflorum TaxID=4521 RepID=A0AAD8U3Z1_LOLMU|nr:hypothetical protein QYE76_016262 [Lolium multiflorum]